MSLNPLENVKPLKNDRMCSQIGVIEDAPITSGNATRGIGTDCTRTIQLSNIGLIFIR